MNHPYREPACDIPVYEEPMIEREPMLLRVVKPRDPASWSAQFYEWVGIPVMKLGEFYLVQFDKDDASALFYPDELARVRPV